MARLRRYAEHLLAPQLRADVARLGEDGARLELARAQLRDDVERLAGIVDGISRRLDDATARLSAIQAEHATITVTVERLSERIGPVLESVLTTNEITRLARREMDELRGLIDAARSTTE